MSDLYKADASKFTREQLVELINHQTQLHVQGESILVVAKHEIESLKNKLSEKDKQLDEAVELLRESFSVIECHASRKELLLESIEKFLAKIKRG